MPNHNGLPNEVLRIIFNEVPPTSKNALLDIRLANHRFCSLVTPYAFQTVHVRDTSASTRKFHSILMSPHLVKEIREVFILQGGPGSEVYHEEDIGQRESLMITLVELRRAMSLRSLNIQFFWTRDDPPTKHTSVICSLIAGIPPCSLTSLSLNANYLDYEAFKTQTFASKISALTHLSIITPCTPGFLGLWDFWNDIVSPHFLQPVMGTLTSLTLHPVGLVLENPNIPFWTPFFPRLTYLSLRLFLFKPTNDLEDFIVRHGATLTHLHLEMCPILNSTLPFHSQSDVWIHFMEKLEVLIEVTVIDPGNNNGLGDNGLGSGIQLLSRYMAFNGWCYYRDSDVEVPERLREDDAALELFKSVVNTRRGGSRP